MAEVNFAGATCCYKGNPEPAVDSLDLDIADGEFMVLVGPSGSGKSTALRMLAGLEDLSSGEIRIGGRDVSGMHPKKRDIAMVFQSYALYPHMKVADNMGFGLKLKGVGKADRMVKVRETAKLLDLEPLLERKPRALSGGQRQRVAMGRAIVREPSAFLMDEPLSNLDAKLRVETRANISALQKRLGTTTIFVTHDQVEAMTMGDRVSVLKDGILQQVGSPRELYEQPRNAFVAGFIGSPGMNLREVPIGANGPHLGGEVIAFPEQTAAALRGAAPDRVIIGIRPEASAIKATDGALQMKVILVEELGSDSYVYGLLAGDEPGIKPFIVRCNGRDAPGVGEVVPVSVPSAAVHAFDCGSGLRVG